MKKLIDRIRKAFHICYFNKPIASRYLSFHGREIVYECKCKKRKVENVYRSFDSPFPIETNMFMTYQDVQKLLKETN